MERPEKPSLNSLQRIKNNLPKNFSDQPLLSNIFSPENEDFKLLISDNFSCEDIRQEYNREVNIVGNDSNPVYIEFLSFVMNHKE